MEQIIFIDENIPLLANAMNSCGKITCFSGRSLTNRLLIDSGCTSLFIRSTTKVSRVLIDGTNVKFIGSATSGIDHVDTEFLISKKIKFCFAPGSNANSVAEYVVFSILAWGFNTKSEIQNKTIGIVGFGNIGNIVANYSKYLGLNILVNDPILKDEGFVFPNFVQYAGLEEICTSADIITNHVPLTIEGLYPTYKLFNKNLRLIKSGSLFIHTSRGGVVDESELLLKIKSDNILTAIDVWENEPCINRELVSESLISTPHIAGYSKNGKIRGAKMMAEAFRNFTGLEPDFSEINKELAVYHPMSPDSFRDYNNIYNLLSISRELVQDTFNLKEIIQSGIDDKDDIFDKLRKNYAQRCEIL